MPTKLQTDASLHYCDRIKNDVAREYAKKYRLWFMGQTSVATAPTAKDLDALNAQKIRMNLRFLLD